MRRCSGWLLFLLLLLTIPCAVAGASGLDDYDGARIGVQTGSSFVDTVLERLPAAQLSYFEDAPSQVLALQSGQIDAFPLDEPVAKVVRAQTEGITFLEERLRAESYAMAFSLDRQDLADEASAMILEFQESGLLDELQAKWMDGPNEEKVMPDIKPAGENGTLRVAFFSAGSEPFAYLGPNGEYVGYELELCARLAERLGMGIELNDMNFSAIIPGLQNGKYDVAATCITVTEERKKQVLFSEPTYTGGLVLMVPASDPELEALRGRDIGCLTGLMLDTMLHDFDPTCTPMYFNDYSTQVVALQNGQIDGIIIDEPVGADLVAQNSGIKVVDTRLRVDSYAYALHKDNEELAVKVDEVLAGLKAEGFLQAMRDKWIVGPQSGRVMDEYELAAENGVLRFGTDSTIAPFAYLESDGRMIGYDVEIAYRIAQELGMGLEIQNIDFGGLIPAVQSGKVDFAGACITVTDERREMVRFSDANYENGGICMLIRDEVTAAQGGSFLNGLYDSFYNNFIYENRYQLVLTGFYHTLLISLYSMIIGTILGFALCMMHRSRFMVARGFVKVYLRIIQGTPLVVLLMIVYYVVFRNLNQPILVASIAMGLNFAAHVSEIMRSAILSVSPGQLEAAAAIGFRPRQVFIKITAPQAIKQALPVYKGELINMVKMTSIAGYVAIMDLTKAIDIIRSRTFEAFVPLLVAAAIYILLTSLLVALLNLIEVRVDPKRRKREVRV